MMSLANQRETYAENHPHSGDGKAAQIMRDALVAFQAKAREALIYVASDEGCEAIAAIIDDAIPPLNIWIAKCEEEGEL